MVSSCMLACLPVSKSLRSDLYDILGNVDNGTGNISFHLDDLDRCLHQGCLKEISSLLGCINYHN